MNRGKKEQEEESEDEPEISKAMMKYREWLEGFHGGHQGARAVCEGIYAQILTVRAIQKAGELSAQEFLEGSMVVAELLTFLQFKEIRGEKLYAYFCKHARDKKKDAPPSPSPSPPPPFSAPSKDEIGDFLDHLSQAVHRTHIKELFDTRWEKLRGEIQPACEALYSRRHYNPSGYDAYEAPAAGASREKTQEHLLYQRDFSFVLSRVRNHVCTCEAVTGLADWPIRCFLLSCLLTSREGFLEQLIHEGLRKYVPRAKMERLLEDEDGFVRRCAVFLFSRADDDFQMWACSFADRFDFMELGNAEDEARKREAVEKQKAHLKPVTCVVPPQDTVDKEVEATRAVLESFSLKAPKKKYRG
jgi:hypothetical protein